MNGVTWAVLDAYALTLEGSNLTDEIRYVYGKTKDQPMEIYHWGRTVSLTDAYGKAWTTAYDLQGRVTATIDPLAERRMVWG